MPGVHWTPPAPPPPPPSVHKGLKATWENLLSKYSNLLSLFFPYNTLFWCSDSSCKGNCLKILRFKSLAFLDHLSFLHLRSACATWCWLSKSLTLTLNEKKYKALRVLESILCNKILVPKTTIWSRFKTKKSIFLHWNNLRVKETNWEKVIVNK